MSDNAIRAMMAEQSENNDSDSDASDTATDDATDFTPSPLTEGYHVVTGSVDLLRDIAMAVANEAGHEVEKPSEVTGDFNPRDYKNALDEAAMAAMDASVFDEPKAIVGLLGAMDALKKRWGAQHPEKVSGEGYHGVGLNTDGTYAKCRDGSYGQAYPEAPHFDQVVGVEGLDGGERSFLTDELGIPVSDIGPAGNVLLPTPDGERLPIAFSGDDALNTLADVVDSLEGMPEIPGPDGFEGEASPTTDEAAEAASDAEFNPTEFTVAEIRERATDLDSLEVVEEAIEVEKANKDRKGAKERLTQRANALRDEQGDDEEAVEDATDADESDEGDSEESVEGSTDDAVLTLLQHDSECDTIEEAREKAEAHGLA